MSSLNPEQAASPGLLRIFASMVYDTLLLAAISIAYGAIITALSVVINGAPPQGERIHYSSIAQVSISLGWLLILTGFYAYFWTRFGQSLGMKTWRIQVVDAQTLQIPSLSQALKRSACAWLSLLFFGAGYWLSLIHPQKRLLHDLVSKTRLVLLKKTK